LREKAGLKRELGLLHATMIGIGGAISAGVFVMLGYAVTLAGTTVVIALVLCGIINLFTMCSYAELGAALPRAGGEYTFAKVAYGGFVSFLTGWFEWISNMFFAALSAVGFAYMIPYIIPIPMTLTTVAILATIVIAIFTAINIRGIKEAGTAEAIMIIILLIILIAYILGGLSNPRIEAFQLYAPEGFLGVVRATAYIFAVYLGAEAVAVAQAEVKNPSKTIPRAILLSAAVLIVFYTIIAYVTLRTVPPEQLTGETAPIIFAAEQAMGKLGTIVLVIAGTIAALSSLNTSIMAQSRVCYALSRDGYFPKALCRIHHRFSTPHVAVVLGAIFTVVLAGTGVINFVGYATDFGFIIGFALVNLSLMKLRKEKPRLERPFKTPLYPFTPIAGVVTSLFLLIFIDVGVLSFGVALSVLAVLAYYIRMVGYLRFRVAFGGISLALGCFTLIPAYLIMHGTIPLSGAMATIALSIIIFASIIQIVAGILNVAAENQKF
jgi:amino acid transporter